jgi:non-ribosomal peptide synthetase component F
VWELWGALTYGGLLLVPSVDKTRDIDSFYDLCVKYKVSVLNQTPSAFYRFAEIANNKKDKTKKLNSLRYIIFGGEALNSHRLKDWWNYQDNNKLITKLINMYGITETTVHVTYKELQKSDIVESNIGRPIPDLKSYILDKNLQPLPPGVIGELYIGGAGLARGYLNREDLTSERFISNPYATERDMANGYTRLYKTGDLCRYLEDGNIEYIGRNDDQVKIRG